jgi:hypothetical protein
MNFITMSFLTKLFRRPAPGNRGSSALSYRVLRFWELRRVIRVRNEQSIPPLLNRHPLPPDRPLPERRRRPKRSQADLAAAFEASQAELFDGRTRENLAKITPLQQVTLSMITVR